MYFPFRNETELKFNSSYANKLRFTGVLDTVNFNRRKVKPYAIIFDDPFERFQDENQANMDPFGHQENVETYAELKEKMWNS